MPTHMNRRPLLLRIAAVSLLVLVAAVPRPTSGVALDPIVYTMRFPVPDSHVATITARVPSRGSSSIDLMLPVVSRLLPDQ